VEVVILKVKRNIIDIKIIIIIVIINIIIYKHNF